jgi:hypothetical protein
MVDIFKRLLKIQRGLKSRGFYYLLDSKRTLRKMKTYAELWMEARYAIRPLFFDAVSILNAAYNRREIGDRLTFRGGERVTETDTLTTERVNTGFTFLVEGTVQRTVNVRAGVLACIQNLTPMNNWGFDSIGESIWELLPYSFVIDWFLNVGKTIAALTPEGGLRTLASWYVVEDTILRKATVTDSYRTDCQTQDISCVYDITGASVQYLTVQKYRRPDPKLSWYPTFKLRLDPKKLLDLVIMVSQLAGRRYRGM